MSVRALWLLFLAACLTVGISERTHAQHSSPTKPPVGVPSDAIYFKGRWYRVYVEKGGWKRARERCAIVGGRLAVVSDSATRDFIKELASELPLWLGATDEKTEGQWLWINGSRMIYDAWEEGQPNNGRREHYLMIARNGMWHDVPENEPSIMGYICEWNRK